nr:hypothetical protein CFP56_10410 [Quercus suber]
MPLAACLAPGAQPDLPDVMPVVSKFSTIERFRDDCCIPRFITDLALEQGWRHRRQTTWIETSIGNLDTLFAGTSESQGKGLWSSFDTGSSCLVLHEFAKFPLLDPEMRLSKLDLPQHGPGYNMALMLFSAGGLSALLSVLKFVKQSGGHNDTSCI